MCQLNVSGLSNHTITALEKFIADQKIDILALQEIGMNKHPHSLFQGKCTYTSHNVKGVALSIDTTLHPQVINDFSNCTTDDLWVLCTISSKPVLLGTGYCQPEINSANSLKELLTQLSKARLWCKSKKIDNMIMFGDFNARSVNWGDTVDNQRGRTLCDFIDNEPEASLHSAGTRTFLTLNGEA